MDGQNFGLKMTCVCVQTSLYSAPDYLMSVEEIERNARAGLQAMLGNPEKSLHGMSIEEAVGLAVRNGIMEGDFERTIIGGRDYIRLSPAGVAQHVKIDMDYEFAKMME